MYIVSIHHHLIVVVPNFHQYTNTTCMYPHAVAEPLHGAIVPQAELRCWPARSRPATPERCKVVLFHGGAFCESETYEETTSKNETIEKEQKKKHTTHLNQDLNPMKPNKITQTNPTKSQNEASFCARLHGQGQIGSGTVAPTQVAIDLEITLQH